MTDAFGLVALVAMMPLITVQVMGAISEIRAKSSAGQAPVSAFADDEIIVQAKDRGPGIADIEWACRDGTSTANDWIRSMGFGAGMGLSNSKRVADAFDIQSELGKFTKVTCTFNLTPQA